MQERGHILPRQEVKVENKVSVATFTSRNEKSVGEEREEDTTEETLYEFYQNCVCNIIVCKLSPAGCQICECLWW